MFGYLKLTGLPKHSKENRIYRTYYCGTCTALKQNYGRISTIILNYDLIIVPIVLEHNFDVPEHCMKCTFKKKKIDLYSNDFWKSIAAFNLAMVYASIYDNESDGNSKSLKHKIIKALLKRAFRKAASDYPALFEFAKNGINDIVSVENDGQKLEAQSEAFSKMFNNMLECLFTISDEEKLFFSSISYWLCYIDALDDYEKDKTKGTYNPLLIDSKTKKQFVSESYMQLYFVYNCIYTRLKNFYKSACVSQEYSGIPVFKYLIYNKIPSVTSKVLRRNR